MESQSRYAIVESLNEQKRNAQKKLAETTKQLTSQEIAHLDFIAEREREIATKKANYKSDHESWVTRKNLDIEAKKRDLENEIVLLKNEISEANASVERNFKKFVEAKEAEINSQKDRWEKYNRIQAIEKTALEADIKQIETAIKDLKEISKEDKERAKA